MAVIEWSHCYIDIQDSTADSEEKCRATLMLCYGYVTLYAPPELAVSRLEANILNVVVPQLTSVKVWHKMSIQFQSFPPSVRYIYVQITGDLSSTFSLITASLWISVRSLWCHTSRFTWLEQGMFVYGLVDVAEKMTKSTVCIDLVHGYSPGVTTVNYLQVDHCQAGCDIFVWDTVCLDCCIL